MLVFLGVSLISGIAHYIHLVVHSSEFIPVLNDTVHVISFQRFCFLFLFCRWRLINRWSHQHFGMWHHYHRGMCKRVSNSDPNFSQESRAWLSWWCIINPWNPAHGAIISPRRTLNSPTLRGSLLPSHAFSLSPAKCTNFSCITNLSHVCLNVPEVPVLWPFFHKWKL